MSYGRTLYGRSLYGDPYIPEVLPVTAAYDEETAAGYAEAYADLLPPGPLWDVDRDADLSACLDGQSRELARAHAQLQKLQTEMFPLTLTEMLREWEVMMGLPDDCAPPALSVEARRAAVAAAFIPIWGHTFQNYIDMVFEVFGVVIAVTGGYKVAFTVSDGTGSDIPPWSGSVIGDPLWTHADWLEWTATFPAEIEDTEMADRIECFLRRINQSHTTLIIAYA